MIRPFSRKRLLAVPAVLTLALGGAVLTAVPATAAPLDPVQITSPTSAQVFTERTLTVSGTGSDGDTVTVSAASEVFAPVPVIVAAGGAWETTVTFPETAAAAQTIEAEQTDAASTVSSDTTDVVVPAPASVVEVPTPLVITSPSNGEYIPSRFVVFEGTAPAGALVEATVNGGTGNNESGYGYGDGFVQTDGTFRFQALFDFQLGNDLTVVLTATTLDGTRVEVAAPVSVDISLPGPLATPVITSPTSGSSITGEILTIRGTGTPGTTADAVLYPTDDATEAKLVEVYGPSFDRSTLLPSAVVAADGTFVLTATLPPGDYAFEAYLTDTPREYEALSLFADPVAFSLVAPPAAATTPRPQLAATGALTDGLAIPTGLVILTGVGLIALSRRRTSGIA